MLIVYWRKQALQHFKFPPNMTHYNLLSGRFIFDFFARAGLTVSTYPTLMDQCGKAISMLTAGSGSLHLNGNNVQKFVDAAKVVICTKSGPFTIMMSWGKKVG